MNGVVLRRNLEAIPDDLIIEVLVRLPVKAIARFRCVSKLWRSIFGCRYFTELFLTRSLTRPKLLIAYHYAGELFFMSLPQPQNMVLGSDSVVVAATPLMRFPLEHPCVIGNYLRGLVCHAQVSIKGRRVKGPTIYNPSTGRSLTLPNIDMRLRGNSVNYLLGYDPINKQFKILYIDSSTRDEVVSQGHFVLTLGIGELSWRMIECNILFYPLRDVICINGFLYYTAYHKSLRTSIIVCFDVRIEKFSFLEVSYANNASMINYNDKLGLFWYEGRVRSYLDGESRSFELWVLENLEKNKWSKHSYVLPALWKSRVGNNNLRFVGVTQTNEFVFAFEYSNSPSDFLFYNHERKTIVRVEIQGLLSNGVGVYMFLDHVEDLKLLM